MIPRNRRKIAKNLAAYSKYQEMQDAAKVAKALSMEHKEIMEMVGNPYRHRYSRTGDFRTAVGNAIAEGVCSFKRARRSTAVVSAPATSTRRFDDKCREISAKITENMIRGWRIDLGMSPLKDDVQLMVVSQNVHARIPKGMIYRAGREKAGYLPYITALIRSPMTGICLLGISSEFRQTNPIIGEVWVGLAAFFRSSESDLGLQYRWFCMGKKLKGKWDYIAPCGFGDDPESAAQAAVRSSAKVMRDSLREGQREGPA